MLRADAHGGAPWGWLQPGYCGHPCSRPHLEAVGEKRAGHETERLTATVKARSCKGPCPMRRPRCTVKPHAPDKVGILLGRSASPRRAWSRRLRHATTSTHSVSRLAIAHLSSLPTHSTFRGCHAAKGAGGRAPRGSLPRGPAYIAWAGKASASGTGGLVPRPSSQSLLRAARIPAGIAPPPPSPVSPRADARPRWKGGFLVGAWR